MGLHSKKNPSPSAAATIYRTRGSRKNGFNGKTIVEIRKERGDRKQLKGNDCALGNSGGYNEVN